MGLGSNHESKFFKSLGRKKLGNNKRYFTISMNPQFFFLPEWAKDNSGCLLRTRPGINGKMNPQPGCLLRTVRNGGERDWATHNVRNRVAPVTGGWATTDFGGDGSRGIS
ncbi:hypothetical protein Fot_29256 [Forsythia ovata]|uniref:Uncharacterized protein n=1 Tax=Forsythia ovata TaxID=205694 RepID=A0ABD1TS56_9LAMI